MSSPGEDAVIPAPEPLDPFVAEQRAALPVSAVAALAALGLDLVLTTRRGGVSSGSFASLNLGDHVGDRPHDVNENRTRLARAMGVTRENLVIVRQCHGATVVDAATATERCEGDVILLEQNDRAAAILVADCLALALVNASTHRVALVHAGWRGLAAGTIAAAYNEVAGGDGLVAFLGPCISVDQYQVGPEVAENFLDVPGAVVSDIGDRSRLDLRLVAAHQLRRLGVSEDQVIRSSQSTDGGVNFFSDRAQRPCGRFGLVAKWSS